MHLLKMDLPKVECKEDKKNKYDTKFTLNFIYIKIDIIVSISQIYLFFPSRYVKNTIGWAVGGALVPYTKSSENT